jgi:hypothetical protein
VSGNAQGSNRSAVQHREPLKIRPMCAQQAIERLGGDFQYISGRRSR